MLNSISRLGETGAEMKWSNGNGIFRLFRFSGILGQLHGVHPKSGKMFVPFAPPMRNVRNLWSNEKRPLFPEPPGPLSWCGLGTRKWKLQWRQKI